MLFLAIALLILAHEAGHVAAAWDCRLPVRQVRLGRGPVLGTWHCGGVGVMLRLLPLDFGVCFPPALLTPRLAAHIALGGLLWGLAASLVVMALAVVLHAPRLLDAGAVFLVLNLYNALPLPGLDGARLVHAKVR